MNTGCIMGGMTDTLAPADPRIGALVDLVQGITAKYSTLATMVLPHLNEADRATALRDVQEVSEAIAQRLSEIATMGPQ